MTAVSITRGVVVVLAALTFVGAAGATVADAAPVSIDDTEAPRGAVGGISSPASGTLTLHVRVSDVGLGLANAQASIDGAVVASTDLGGSGSVEDLQMPVATPMFGDGPHQLTVRVTDAAGNGAVLVDQQIVINNTPPFQQSTAVLTLGTGDAGSGSGGVGGSGGSGGSDAGVVGGAGSVMPGSGPVCRAPRLSMFLKDKPLKIVKGVPVLRRNGRYRFSGTLTCAVGRRRVRAPSGVVVALRNQIGKRIYKKNGVATRSGGGLSVILAYPSSRLLEFRYASVDGTTTRVRLRITIVKATKKKAVR